MQPYVDEKITDSSWIRTFDPTFTDSEEYVWHVDKFDREVIVLDGCGWRFQFDDEIPFDININDQILIPKMVYHRLIIGNTKLRIKINEKL